MKFSSNLLTAESALSKGTFENVTRGLAEIVSVSDSSMRAAP